MKKISVLLMVFTIFLFVSCEDNMIREDRKAARQKARISREVVQTPTQTPVETQITTIHYEPAPLSEDGNSYWFIVAESKDGSGSKYNRFIKQNHSYFSYKEAKALFSVDVFIVNIVQISRETYEHN